MKSLLTLSLTAVAAISSAYGGPGTMTEMPEMSMAQPQMEVADSFEAGRGLLTLEGPSGMFINPTSATLPRNTFTLQYCFFLPQNNSDVVGHGLLAAYGVTDWLELGAYGNYIDINDGVDDELTGAGPFARVRLIEPDGFIPQVSIGAYSRFSSDDALPQKIGAFAAAYTRVPIDEAGFLKSVGFHYGVRNVWLDGADDTFNGFIGAELQFPYRFYVVGEVSTKDDDTQSEVPYSFGVQWRAAGVNISVAGIQDGNLDDPGFYFGIGYGLTF
ncbi:MAG: hypothetical protein R3F19_03360 [Verrucomicrobiales bacterium]